MIRPKTFNSTGNFIILLAALFILRMVFSVGLYYYAESLNPKDPVLAMSQLTKVSDTLKYHRRAKQLASHWRESRQNIAGGWPTVVRPYSFILACLYYVAGPHPLAAAFVNSLCAVLMALLARGLALKIGQPPNRASWLALLVAAWPPTIIWGALPLKDMLSLTFFFTYIYFLSALFSPQPDKSFSRTGLHWLGFFISVYLGITLRPWLERATPFLLLLMATVVLWRLFTARYLAAIGVLAGALLLLAGAYLGITVPVHVAVQMDRADMTPFAPGDQEWVKDHQVNLRTATRFVLRYVSPKSTRIDTDLKASRREYRHEGGNTVISPGKQPESASVKPNPQAPTPAYQPGLFALGFRSAINFLFRPHPGDLLRTGLSPTATLFSLFVMSIWYVMLPGVAVGGIIALRKEFLAAMPVLFLCCGTGLAMGYVVINLGTLFRVRDSAILPLLLFWDPWPYQMLSRFFSKK